MIWRGWITGGTQAEFEARGIVVRSIEQTAGRNEKDWTFRCEMTEEVLNSIGTMWHDWYWGLLPVEGSENAN